MCGCACVCGLLLLLLSLFFSLFFLITAILLLRAIKLYISPTQILAFCDVRKLIISQMSIIIIINASFIIVVA